MSYLPKQNARNLEKKWSVAPGIPDEISDELHSYPGPLRQLLFNRGITSDSDAQNFLGYTEAEDYDPFLMLGMDQAVERILRAIREREVIFIYGDYDADGVTSSALLYSFFEAVGISANVYIPDRFDEGYGVNQDALESIKADGADLVITVDCGIRSISQVEYANQINLDVVITDHHEPADELPNAVAVINPKQPGDIYPFKDLAGVGVAFKLVSALISKGNFDISPDEFLDLVALGTVADLVVLHGENRSLVRRGLNALKRPYRPGVAALMREASINPSNITSTDIAFGLAPRLNAPGRLDSAIHSFNLLTASDMEEAVPLAQSLGGFNRARQKITREIQSKAEKQVKDSGDFVLFAFDEEFPAGVVGLAASRLTENHHLPTIIGHIDGDLVRCSCRSIPEFHITQALESCSDLLVQYGGHAAAAGLTVHQSQLPEFVARINSIAKDSLSTMDDVGPVLDIDANVTFSDLNLKLLQMLDSLEPIGMGNPTPIFATYGVRVLFSKKMGSDFSHLKFRVSDGYLSFDAVAFQMGYLADMMPELVDLAFEFSLNEFRGKKTMQLIVRDIRPSTF